MSQSQHTFQERNEPIFSDPDTAGGDRKRMTVWASFEGGPDGRYSAMRVARFNLSWILDGEPTRDGELPQWVGR